MRLKPLFIGLVTGIVLGAGGMWIYGQQLRDNVADATEELGDTVQNVGQKLEKTGDELR